MADKKVFISYSHDSEQHKDWVRKLAEDLTRRGIYTILDQWDVGPGDNLAVFMEASYRKSDYMLLVCTANYAQKMNERIGGVQYEAELIAGALMYGESSQKFIPLLIEGTAAENIPVFVKTRYYVSFTDEKQYDHSLESLLMRIRDAPKYVRPPLGAPPAPHRVNDSNVHQKPKARIMVAGTGVSFRMNARIEGIARDVGTMLARNHYGLVTSGWAGVDEIAARAYADEIMERNLPLENFLTQVIFKNSVPRFTAGNLILIDSDQEDSEPIRQSNGVIMIHGVGGTRKMGLLGLEKKLFVFPLADSVGDAGDLYMYILQNWDQLQFAGLNVVEFQKLGRPVHHAVKSLPELLEKSLLPH